MTNYKPHHLKHVVGVEGYQVYIKQAETVKVLADGTKLSGADETLLDIGLDTVAAYQVPTGKTFHAVAAVITAASAGDLDFYQGDTEDAVTT